MATAAHTDINSNKKTEHLIKNLREIKAIILFKNNEILNLTVVVVSELPILLHSG